MEADVPLAGPSSEQDVGGDESEQKKANVRKRTKTGCITCRKRRIKCDEQHPQCRNCLKSRRHCEGYVKKLGWKPPLDQSTYGEEQQINASHLHSLHSTNQPRNSPNGPLPMIAPRPFAHLGALPASSASNVHGFEPYSSAQPPILTFDGLTNSLQAPATNPFTSDPGNITWHPDFMHTANGYQPDNMPSQQQETWSQDPATISSYHAGAAREDLSFERPWLNLDAHAKDTGGQRIHLGLPHDQSDPRAPIRAQKQPMGWLDLDEEADLEMAHQLETSLAHRLATPHNVIFGDHELHFVYSHFKDSTGPTISLYERPPYQVPGCGAESSLWNYTMPSLALHNPGLLHALLALGSLQLAMLDGRPATTALKQCHLSIARLSKSVEQFDARNRIGTLATTLLLSYFEVWQSDHAKWCSHMFGASILLGEIPLATMSQRCLPAKRFKFEQQKAELFFSAAHAGRAQRASPMKDFDVYDYDLLSQLSGHVVSPAQYGLQVGQDLDSTVLSTTDKDIETYETLRDLFWWYNKLDVYQSFLGGSKLLRKYELWTDCPPRAAACMEDAIYGSYDHVILLLGRLANFASKDLPRKRRVASTAPGPKAGSPQFPGIVPTSAKVTVSRAFRSSTNKSPRSESNQELDLDISYKEAMREWESIRSAFEALKMVFETAIAPLRDEYADRRESPFGPTLQYRSFAMAGIWMNYYMGMIQLYRSHPDMPPAAMPAAHIADLNTREYAMMIGRIAAGITSQREWVDGAMDWHTGAAYVESSFCLFVAGVQLKDNAQRHWVVRRMHDIVARVGWQSGVQIANALEGGWLKMAQMGRGPPYTRAQDLGTLAEKIDLYPRRVDRKIIELGFASQSAPLANSGRANLALGLIGIEDDLAVLQLDDEGVQRVLCPCGRKIVSEGMRGIGVREILDGGWAT